MYSQAQFQTGPSAGLAYATREGGIGADKYNQNIRDYAANNPNATPSQIRAEMDKYGISGYDVAQARGGSMWGTPLAMPSYGQLPGVSTGFTPIERMAVPEIVTPAPAGDYGYAQGGAVKTHFQDGGLNDLSDRYHQKCKPICPRWQVGLT